MKSPFKVDWCDMFAVIQYCIELNKIANDDCKSSVVKYHNRRNYNITHSCRVSSSSTEYEIVFFGGEGRWPK